MLSSVVSHRLWVPSRRYVHARHGHVDTSRPCMGRERAPLARARCDTGQRVDIPFPHRTPGKITEHAGARYPGLPRRAGADLTNWWHAGFDGSGFTGWVGPRARPTVAHGRHLSTPADSPTRRSCCRHIATSKSHRDRADAGYSHRQHRTPRLDEDRSRGRCSAEPARSTRG